MRRFGALDRQLRVRFARGERELPLLKAIKGAILAAKPPGIWRMLAYTTPGGTIPARLHRIPAAG
jgi:hypothetical protein